ncbi:MAG TPA: hypothetical protein VFJ85_03790 [Acidimicrobiales bacterium]|nr:hypothetical protein [Acidimicrobiales bacterium]
MNTAATVAMEEPVGTLEVWAGRTHTVTRAEAVVLASPPFQRLRRLRQMGLAFHAWPNAENTRASHSLGVAHWASAYLDALRHNGDGTTQALLAGAAEQLEGLSQDVVLRLFGLLHDIDLLPLGHTLRYQSGLFPEPGERSRLAACVASIRAHARAHAFGEAAAEAERAEWLDAFDRHLDAALAANTTPHGRLTAELVNSGLGADLLDFAVRDSFAIGRPQRLHDDLPAGLRLVPTEQGAGLALSLSEGAVAVADDLYRARFEVFAASVFHPVKLAADAMLDLAVRRLGPAMCDSLLPEHRLVAIGDDELLDTVTDVEAAMAARLGGEPVTPALRAGRLHDEVWRTEDRAAFHRRPDAGRAVGLDPAWRDEAEAALLRAIPWAGPGEVIVAVSPAAMQAKPANARFVAADGDVFTLAEAAGRGHLNQAAETAARYDTLWSLRVYLAPLGRSRAGEVAKAAAELFG